MRFWERFRRFWFGRNGADQLYQLMMWVSLVLLLVNLFLGSLLLSLLELVILGLATYRLLSRNIYRRQLENQAFLRLIGGVKNQFKLMRNRFRDRKTHIYRKCPSCRRMLRLPKIAKGKHTVCCPCCGNRFQTNV